MQNFAHLLPVLTYIKRPNGIGISYSFAVLKLQILL